MSDNIKLEKQNAVVSERNADGQSIILNPKFPQYSSQEDRIKTFKSWPRDCLVSEKTLIEAGLFYTGRGDIVKCFHCGTTLKDWQQEDDPVSVHKQNSPVCPVVIAKYKSPNKNYKNRPSAEQAVLEMGIPEIRVEKAVQIYMRKHHGQQHYNSIDLMNIVMDQEPLVPQQSKRYNEENSSALATELSQQQLTTMCIVCKKEPPNIKVCPCLHKVICMNCVKHTERCPLCNQYFHTVAKE